MLVVVYFDQLVGVLEQCLVYCDYIEFVCCYVLGQIFDVFGVGIVVDVLVVGVDEVVVQFYVVY